MARSSYFAQESYGIMIPMYNGVVLMLLAKKNVEN